MKKKIFVPAGLPILLALLFAACVDPLSGVNSDTTRARVAEMPVVDLRLLPGEFIYYSNQSIGLLTLPLDSINASVGTLSFQWLVSAFSNGANAVEVNNTADHQTAYGRGGTSNAFTLSLAPGAPPDYLANVGTRYYALRITNTHPAPNADYSPAVFITPFVKVTIKPAINNSRINSVNADGKPYKDISTKVFVNFDSVTDNPEPVPDVAKENIMIYGSAEIGDGEILFSPVDRKLTVPLKNVIRGRILLAIRGVKGIEECFYTTSVFDDTVLTYTVLGYQRLGADKTDVGTNRLRLEFNLPVDLTIIEIELLKGLTHTVPEQALIRNNGGRIWTVSVEAATESEGYTSPTIRLEETVGVVYAEALPKEIPGAQARPVRVEW